MNEKKTIDKEQKRLNEIRFSLLVKATCLMCKVPSSFARWDHYKVVRYKRALADVSRLTKRRDVGVNVLEMAVTTLELFY